MDTSFRSRKKYLTKRLSYLYFSASLGGICLKSHGDLCSEKHFAGSDYSNPDIKVWLWIRDVLYHRETWS